ADRPEALTGTQVRVDLDPVGSGLDADRLETDALDAWAPTGCNEQPVTADIDASVEIENELVALPSRGNGLHPEHELDAGAAQRFAERLAQRRGLAGKHRVRALDDHRFATEAPNYLRQLHARGAAAEHEQSARHRVHARRFSSSPDALELAQTGHRRH